MLLLSLENTSISERLMCWLMVQTRAMMKALIPPSQPSTTGCSRLMRWRMATPISPTTVAT